MVTHGLLPAIQNGSLSAGFHFHQDGQFEDEEEGIVFHMCGHSACMYGDHRAPCFHDDCLSARLFLVSPKFLATTEYSYTPSICEERQRQGLILRTLAAKLKRGSLNQLSRELCHMVAGYLVHECAVVTAQELALNLCASGCSIDLSRDVYASYVNIDGIPYIQCLRNSPCSGREARGERLFESGQARLVRRIYVGYDYVGVRHILFVSCKDELAAYSTLYTRRLWWRELVRDDGIMEVTAKTDVSLLASDTAFHSLIYFRD